MLFPRRTLSRIPKKKSGPKWFPCTNPVIHFYSRNLQPRRICLVFAPSFIITRFLVRFTGLQLACALPRICCYLQLFPDPPFFSYSCSPRPSAFTRSRPGSETLSLTNARNYSILAKANGRTQIDVQDVTECEDLFLDARRSAALLGSEAGRGYLS